MEVDESGLGVDHLATRRVRITSSHPASEFLEAIEEAGYTPVQAG
jgi:hypothetical protein